MDDYKRILLAVDFAPNRAELSLGSRFALRQATSVAEATGARLEIVHSVTSDRYVDRGGVAVVHEGLPEGAEARLERILSQLGDVEIAAQVVVRDEVPWLAILREVVERGADLVMLGRNDVDEDGAGRLGGVASRLIQACPCPVWVAGAGSHEAPELVLAATDLSPVGVRVLEHGALAARLTGAKLHVVHSYQVPFGEPVPERGEETPRQKEETEAVRRQAEAAGAESAVLHVGCTSPLHAILEGIEVLKPDLLVMGTTRRSGVAGLLLGRTADKVLKRVECSLLVLKPPGFEAPL